MRPTPAATTPVVAIEGPSKRRAPDVVAPAAALLLPTIYSPAVAAPFFSPKAAVLLVSAAAALPVVLGLARRWRLLAPAWAFVAIAGVSSLAATRPALAVAGHYNLGTGWLFLAALAALWCLGLGLTTGGRDHVVDALVGAIALNGVVAAAQVAFDLSDLGIGLYGERAPGLLGNPVHLSALTAGALPLLVLTSRFTVAARLAGTAVFGASLACAGGRVGVALAVVGLAFVARACSWRTTLLVAAALALGATMGSALARESGTTGVADRAEVDVRGGDLGPRLRTWSRAGEAVRRDPLIGAGPGQFRAATVQDRTLAVSRLIPDNYFLDAHNLVIEYAVTTGIAGLAALATWLVVAFRRGRGPLAIFAGIVLLSHLAQPQGLGTTPVAFLALGAAGLLGLPTARARAGFSIVGGLLGAVAAATLLLGDARLLRAQRDFDRDQGVTALRQLPPWPQTATTLGRIETFAAHPERNPEASVRAQGWLRLAADRDPASPALWNDLGDLAYVSRWNDEAREHYEQARRLDRWSVRALNGLADVAEADGDTAAARRYSRLALLVDPTDGKAREHLR